MAISSTDCRERVARGEPVWYLVPDGVVQYINKHHLYSSPEAPSHLSLTGSTMTATDRALELARAAAAAAADKLATTITGIDVSEQLALTDVFVIVSAESERQVGSIVDEVEDTLREMGAKPVRREGQREGRWVLIDFSDIVVHVQHDEERSFYELERLWKDCPSIDLGVVGTEQGGR
jgi:ribosome-associated protein